MSAASESLMLVSMASLSDADREYRHPMGDACARQEVDRTVVRPIKGHWGELRCPWSC